MGVTVKVGLQQLSRLLIEIKRMAQPYEVDL